MLLPLPLLRAILKADPADADQTVADNLAMVYGEVRPEGIDGVLLSYVWSLYDRTGTVPTIATVRAHFDALAAKGDPSGVPGQQRLDAIDPPPALLDPAACRQELDTYKEQALTKVTSAVLLEAAQILKQGLVTKQRVNGQLQTVTIKGADAAVQRLREAVSGLGNLFRSRSVSGTLSEDIEAVWQRWEKAKVNQLAQFGVLSGLNAIDAIHGGIQPGEVALVLGFVAHMKSVFIRNWAYKAAVIYKKRVGVVTLESSTEKLREQFAILHAQHPQFLDDTVPTITSEGVKRGRLTAAQERIWRAVIDDLKTNPDYGQIEYRGMDDNRTDITMEDIGGWVRDITRHDPLDLLVIDYIGLVSPGDARLRGRGNALSEFANLNVTLREAKLLAMAANGGKGLALLSPFQANREGLKDAEKNGGRYTLRALAGANESERSADLVYYVYLDEALRSQREIACGNLKARDVPLIIDQFRLYADGETGLIDDLAPAAPVSP